MADISAAMKDWSSTSSSNNPSGATNVGTGLDDNLREIQGSVVRNLHHKGADIASATTTDLGAVEGLFHDITGTTTITGFGTVRAGVWKVIKFEGALTLTHNSTSLILPGGANITTADGDVAIMTSEGSGNWRCVSYFRAANAPTQDASDTAKGVIEIATQAEQETGTDTAKAVTSGRQHYHPSAAKAWCYWSPAAAIAAAYNVASITDTGTGNWTANFSTAFSSASYAAVPGLSLSSFNGTQPGLGTLGTGSVQVVSTDKDGVLTEGAVNGASVICFGDQ